MDGDLTPYMRPERSRWKDLPFLLACLVTGAAAVALFAYAPRLRARQEARKVPARHAAPSDLSPADQEWSDQLEDAAAWHAELEADAR